MTRRLLAVLALSWPCLGLAEPAADCAIPDELAFTAETLPAAARSVAADHRLGILALGAGSTEGAAARDPARTYPARLEARLKGLMPGIAVEVKNGGVPRADLDAMAKRLDRDLPTAKPALVIWEVGTNDATAQRNPDEFAEALRTQAEKLRAGGVDLVFVDLQFAPSTDPLVAVDRYQDAIARVADLVDAPLLRRYDIMRRWNDSGRFALADPDPAHQTATARAIYDCLAAELARGIAAAARR